MNVIPMNWILQQIKRITLMSIYLHNRYKLCMTTILLRASNVANIEFNLTIDAPIATKVVCFFSSAEMFKKSLL